MLSYVVKLYKCTCCKEEKPICDFYKEAYTGLPTKQCKKCIDIKRKVQREKRQHNKFVAKERCREIEDIEYSISSWCAAMLFFRGGCAFCSKTEGRSKKERFDRDHLIPISKGGKTTKENIVPACKKCNRGRGNKDWKEWFREQDFWTKKQEEKIKEWAGE